MSKTQQNPYVGARPFQGNEGPSFYGREREARDLAALISIERLVLFYGAPGIGRSSLIHASLIPRLKAENITVLPVGRMFGEPPGGPKVDNIFIFNLLLSLDSERSVEELAQMTITEFLSRHTTPASGQPAIRVLIIDQLEEMFMYHADRWQERAGFFEQLGEALAQDSSLSVLLSVREGYVSQLEEYAGRVPGQLRVRFRLRGIGPEAARQAIIGPAQAAGMAFAPGVAETLVDELRRIRGSEGELALGQYVEPIQLQLVCFMLWNQLPPGRQQITPEDISNLGDVDDTLVNYYDDTLARILQAEPEVSEREVRAWFEHVLITPARIRGLAYRDAETTEGLPNAVVDRLAAHWLLRIEHRRGATWVALIHDRYIEPILEANRRWIAQYGNPLTRPAAEWERTERNPVKLLTGSQLLEARSYAAKNPAELTPLEYEFLEQSQQIDRMRFLSRGCMVLVGVAVVLVIAALGVWGLFQASIATDRATNAVATGEYALEQRRMAEATGEYAREQQTTAEAAADLALIAEVEAYQQATAAAAARADALEQANLAATREQQAIVALAVAEDSRIEIERQAAIAENAVTNLEATITVQAGILAATATPTPTPAALPPTATATPVPVTAAPGSSPTPTLRPTPTPTAAPTVAVLTCKFSPQGEFAALWQGEVKAQLGCPTQLTPTGGFFARQRFENGSMYWAQLPDLFVTLIDPPAANPVGEWLAQVEIANYNPNGLPNCDYPAAGSGLQVPVRGFGGVWCEQELWADELLGFATGPEEAVSGNLVQSFDNGYILRDVDTGVTTDYVMVAASATNSSGLYRAITSDTPPHHIIFVSHQHSEADGIRNVYEMDGDGRNIRQITRNLGTEPAYSPALGRVGFTQPAGRTSLYSINRNGSDERLLDDGRWDNWETTFSPDGDWLAFVSSRENEDWEIYKMLTNGQQAVSGPLDCGDVLAEPEGGEVWLKWAPAWSPVGDRIAFVAQPKSQGRGQYDGQSDIWLMDSNGRNCEQLTDSATGVINKYPAWSPDGRQLVFVSNRDGGTWRLYTMTSDGRNQQPVSGTTPENVDRPSWSPDGDWLLFDAYTTPEDLRPDSIWVMKLDGTSLTRLTGDSSDNWHPVWAAE
jgi:hypothetical protein